MTRSKKPSYSSPEKAGLFDKVVEHGISQFVSLLFSVFLIGGGYYFLYQFPAERDALQREIQSTAAQGDPASFNDMLDIFTSSWAVENGMAQLFQRDSILEKFKFKMNANENLDGKSRMDIQTWCSNALFRLSSEKHQISGFVFSNEIEKGVQQNMIQGMDSQIATLNTLCDFPQSWDTKTPKQRLDALNSYHEKIRENANLQSELLSRLGQAKRFAGKDVSQEHAMRQEMETRMTMLLWKKYAAILGMLIGVGAILAMIFIVLGRKVSR